MPFKLCLPGKIVNQSQNPMQLEFLINCATIENLKDARYLTLTLNSYLDRAEDGWTMEDDN